MAWHLVEPGTEYLTNWHIPEICTHLEAVTRGEILKLLINVPPGCMKSLLTSVFWPVWEWIREPGQRLIRASYDARLTLRDANKCLMIMRSDWFQARWGDRFVLPRDPSGADFANSAGGFQFSTSIEGKLTGRHGDTFLVDDPHKPLAISSASLNMVREWWTGTVPTRFRNPKRAKRVVIMQRLHENDLSGIIAKENGWVTLRLPMEYESRAPCYTPIGGDPRMKDGELLWPDRIPRENVEQLKKDLGGRGAAAQLQQRPAPAEGAIFRESWIIREAPPARFDQIIQSWDCTFKGESDSDFVCGQVWGRVGAQYWLLDQIHERLDFPGTIDAICRMRARWPRTGATLIEDKANGPAVISVLRKRIPGIVAVNPEGGKIARANAVAPIWEAGNVRLPPSGFDGLIAELLSFPVGAHDDQVDAMTQALTYLANKVNSFAAAMKALQERGLK